MDNFYNWIYFGDDGFTVKSTGQYRNIKIEFGNGSYREDLDPSSKCNTKISTNFFNNLSNNNKQKI